MTTTTKDTPTRKAHRQKRLTPSFDDTFVLAEAEELGRTVIPYVGDYNFNFGTSRRDGGIMAVKARRLG